MARPPPNRYRQRLKRIRCLLMDVDGVLTDGKLHFGNDGAEFKTFDVQDGHGIAMAQRAGLTIGFISGRPSKATERRAADLGVKIVLQKATNKMEMLEKVKRTHGFRNDQIAFIGDELVDLPVLSRVGLAVAVPNAMEEVKRAAHYVTRRAGGDGAVREVIEMILKAQGAWRSVIARYMTLLLAMWATALPALAGNGDSKPRPVEATGYIEKFEVPERDDDGNLKWKLMGDRAQIQPDGLMNVSNLRAEFYTSNKVDMVFTAPTCTLDRMNKRASTDGPVRIQRANMVLTGIGGDWSDENSTFHLRSNVRLILTGEQTIFSEPQKPHE